MNSMQEAAAEPAVPRLPLPDGAGSAAERLTTRVGVPLFIVTTFASAFLIFLVQPMIGKRIVPSHCRFSRSPLPARSSRSGSRAAIPSARPIRGRIRIRGRAPDGLRFECRSRPTAPVNGSNWPRPYTNPIISATPTEWPAV